ncbi:MAG: HipA domain-containing protein [Propionibacteriaceae bacterium]|jgi:serine/threonine-protein kinase HipA|nr:HipA domain-containing protein [Propionibacteriaceae bacterium]
MSSILLHALLNGEHIGIIHSEPRKTTLTYDPGATRSLSLSMPTSKRRWKSPWVGNWLAALLPDRESTLQRWRVAFGVKDHAPEALIPYLGEDVAGAAQFVREDRLQSVTSRSGTASPVTDDEIADLLHNAQNDMLPIDAAAAIGQFSLAGAQPKLALQKGIDGKWALPHGAEPSTHILKPAMPGFADQDVAEALVMRAAKYLGLLAAEVTISQFKDTQALVIARYDRVFQDGRWQRVHQEDLCQAMGIPPLLKYESQGGPGVSRCATFLADHCADTDVKHFAQSLIFNYLIKGSDAHARNYSLILPETGTPTLAMLYDLNSTLPYPGLVAANSAMRIGGEFRFEKIGLLHWARFATETGQSEEWVRGQLADMAAKLPDALSTAVHTEDLREPAVRIGPLLTNAVAAWCEDGVPR